MWLWQASIRFGGTTCKTRLPKSSAAMGTSKTEMGAIKGTRLGPSHLVSPFLKWISFFDLHRVVFAERQRNGGGRQRELEHQDTRSGNRRQSTTGRRGRAVCRKSLPVWRQRRGIFANPSSTPAWRLGPRCQQGGSLLSNSGLLIVRCRSWLPIPTITK